MTRKYYQIEHGPDKGKFMCVGGTVVGDTEDDCAKFEKEYYGD